MLAADVSTSAAEWLVRVFCEVSGNGAAMNRVLAGSNLSIRVSTRCSPRIVSLRSRFVYDQPAGSEQDLVQAESYIRPATNPVERVTDQFDKPGKSVHVRVRSQGRIVGVARLTMPAPQDASVVETWTGLNLGEIRAVGDARRLGRLVEISRVVSLVERCGIFGLTFCQALRMAEQRGMTEAVCVVRPELPSSLYLQQALGFEDCGLRGLISRDVPGQDVGVILLRRSLDQVTSELSNMTERSIEKVHTACGINGVTASSSTKLDGVLAGTMG